MSSLTKAFGYSCPTFPVILLMIASLAHQAFITGHGGGSASLVLSNHRPDISTPMAISILLSRLEFGEDRFRWETFSPRPRQETTQAGEHSADELHMAFL
jgi:hypothetical protein